jgi:hypothetical protein
MMRLLTAMLAVGAGMLFTSPARAGGPPPMYVVVDTVVMEPTDAPERITIRGSFIRVNDGPGRDYGPPVEGFVTLKLDPAKAAASRTEWKKWAKAAGTGKVVAVGICHDGGSMLQAKIHKPGEKPGAADAVYTPDHLTDIEPPTGGNWSDQAAVKTLVKFVQDRKAIRAAAGPPSRP